MKEIEQIYHNDFGVTFYWKKQNQTLLDKVQVVFKETGFYFTHDELNHFCQLIEESVAKNNPCESCDLKHSCHTILLRTPCHQIDLAVSMKELNAIKDLIEGSLFKIKLDEYVYGVGLN